MHPGGHWRLGHRPALDGLRGIAILLVLLAHATHGWLANFGSTGVTVFFALSGFLITALLLEERGRMGRISLGRFYQRRVRRLLPALAAYLAFWVLLAAVGVSLFQTPAGQVVGAVLYMTNWMMAAGVSVFDPLAITWSLSIEEQFYLAWPLVLLAGVRWPRLPWVVAIGCISYSVVARLVIWSPEHAGSLYYRSDTRMDSLLIGCLLALAVTRFGVPAWCRNLLWPGAAGLAVLLAWPSAWLHTVGEPALVAVATMVVIAAILAGSGVGLAWPPLRWLGRRSYALYLWHYPLMSLAWSFHVYPMWVGLLLALVAAETSWWLVERPFQRRPQATMPQVPEPAHVPPPPADAAAEWTPMRVGESAVP